MNIKNIILSVFIFFSIYTIASAQEEELYFTYIGPVFSGGINRITYRDWSTSTDERFSKDVSGYFFGGGLLMNIFVRNFIGDFTLEYISNSMDDDRVSLQHLLFTTSFKYSYSFNEIFRLAAGAGCYLETPPASEDYDAGGGVNGTLGGVFTINREIRILADVICRYGYFGIGDDSYKFSIGGKIGAVYRVGRI